MFQDKLLKRVQAGLQHVPKPIVSAMKSKPVLTSCVVVGTGLAAYGNNNVTGGQAIAGITIGLGVVAVQSIPLGKIFSAAMTIGRRK